uniref:Carbonyl reductase 1 n=1 Tax=Oryzias sinensis TaxID=183150 RepID=A0A8C8DIX7_9TELE
QKIHKQKRLSHDEYLSTKCDESLCQIFKMIIKILLVFGPADSSWLWERAPPFSRFSSLILRGGRIWKSPSDRGGRCELLLWFWLPGRVVNVSSFVSCRTLNQCSPELQQRFRSEDISEEELAGLMQRFVDKAKAGQHKQDGWPEMAYGVSKTGLTVLSMILARRLSKERPNDGILLNACCPGWVRTDMAGPNAPKSPEEGAVTPVYLALLPPGATEPHGKFVSEKEVQPW